jgi:hypothetical protein
MSRDVVRKAFGKFREIFEDAGNEVKNYGLSSLEVSYELFDNRLEFRVYAFVEDPRGEGFLEEKELKVLVKAEEYVGVREIHVDESFRHVSNINFGPSEVRDSAKVKVRTTDEKFAKELVGALSWFENGSVVEDLLEVVGKHGRRTDVVDVVEPENPNGIPYWEDGSPCRFACYDYFAPGTEKFRECFEYCMRRVDETDEDPDEAVEEFVKRGKRVFNGALRKGPSREGFHYPHVLPRVGVRRNRRERRLLRPSRAEVRYCP